MAYRFDEIVGSTEICTKAEIQPVILGITSDITTLQSNLTTLGTTVASIQTSINQACSIITTLTDQVSTLSCQIGCINTSLACKLGCVAISGVSPISVTNTTSSQTTASYTISLGSGYVIPTSGELDSITSQLADLQGITYILSVYTDTTCLQNTELHELSSYAGLEYREYTEATSQGGITYCYGGTHISGSLQLVPDEPTTRYNILLCTAEGFTVPNTYDVIQIHHAKRILGGTTILTSDPQASSTTAADQLYTIDDFRCSLDASYYNTVSGNITIPTILNTIGTALYNHLHGLVPSSTSSDRIQTVLSTITNTGTIYGYCDSIRTQVCSGYIIPTEQRYRQIAYNAQILGDLCTNISNEYGCYSPGSFAGALSAANSYFANNPPCTVISALSRLADSITGMTPGFEITIVSTLPSVGQVGKMYLVKDNSSENPNIYNEYLWISADSKFERIGTTETTMTSFVEKTKIGVIDDLSSIQSATLSTTLGDLKTQFNNLVDYLKGISVITSAV